MPEITWKKVWRFFITILLSIAALAIISDIFLFTIQTFVAESFKDIPINLSAADGQQTAEERALLNELDQVWGQSGGLEKRSVVINIEENTATFDFSLVVKKDHPLANIFLGGGMNDYQRAFVEKTFGQVEVNGAKLEQQDFQFPSIQVDPKQGLIEVHFTATHSIGAQVLITAVRVGKTKLPQATSDQVVVNFEGRKLTTIYPYPADATASMLELNNDSDALKNGFVVVTSLPERNPGALSNFLSRQIVLQKVGRALELPFLGSLLSGILEALPILFFLALVWSKRESLSHPLLFLSQVFLALLVIHFTFRIIGAIGGLFSASSSYLSSILFRLSSNLNIPGQALQTLGIASDVLSTSLGYTSVGTVLMGILIPTLLLRRSREWDRLKGGAILVEDPLHPKDRRVKGKRRFSVLAIVTYLIITLMIGIPVVVFYISKGNLNALESRWVVTSLASGLCGLFLMVLARFIYEKLDGKPIPANIAPLTFWVIFIGNLIWSFTIGAMISSQSDITIQTGWGWLVYATCVGAVLVYAVVRIVYSLARHAGVAPELDRRRHSALIFFAIVTAIPMSALYNLSTPAASYYEVWNLASQLDGLIEFIFLAGLTWYFYEEGKSSTALSEITLAVGVIAMATVFYPAAANWLFIPLTFLIGYRLLTRNMQPADSWKELEPLYAPVSENRLSFLEQIVQLNAGERAYQDLQKALSADLGSGKIGYAEFVQKLDDRRKELDASNTAAQLNGKPIKDVALTFGPKKTAWENGKHGAVWAILFSLPWMAIWLFNFMTGEAAAFSYPLWAFFSDLLNLLTSWVGIGFLFGYFYPFLPGKNGLQKGVQLWLLIILPALPLALINNSRITDWQGFLFWVLQVFIHCMLLGLVAFDYMTLRQGYRDWQMLFELHGIPWVGVSISTILIAAGTAVTTLFQSQTQQIVTAALNFILPNADKLQNLLPK